MSRLKTLLPPLSSLPHAALLVPALVVTNVLLSVTAQSSFKPSAASATWRQFLAWQVVGNLAGFLSVLALTALLRYVPLHVAMPLTLGLTVVGVQVVAARVLFAEHIGPAQWAGAALIVIGIVLVAGRRV